MAAMHEIETIGEVTVLRFRDPALMEFERLAGTSELCDEFFRECPTKKALINFDQIEFWNSASLGLLASLPKKGDRFGRTVSICNLNPKTVWAVQATQLHEILDIFHDEELALASLCK